MMIDGPLDAIRFDRALQSTAAACDVFGLALNGQGGKVSQILATGRQTILDEWDMSKSDDATIVAWMKKRFDQPFDLKGHRLWDLALIKASSNRHFFFMKCHHLMIDGRSVGIFMTMLARNYNRGNTKNSRSSGRYSDFVEDDLHYANSPQFATDQRYWKQRLQGVSTQRFQPKPKSPDDGPTGCLSMPFPHWDNSGDAIDGTPYKIALAGLLITLNRLYGRKDVVIGVPVANRSRNHRMTIGLFSKVLPLRVRISDSMTPAELVETIDSAMNQDMSHIRYPVHQLARGNDQGLFDIAFNHIRWSGALKLNDCHCTVKFLSTALYSGLAISINEQPGSAPEAYFQFDPSVFDEKQTRMLQKRWFHICRILPQNAHRRIADIPALAYEETAQIQCHFNRVGGKEKTFYPIHQIISRQALVHANDTAATMIHGIDDHELTQESVTYAALERRANRLANYLIERGVRSETPVGLYMDRSVNMLVGMLGILKAGGCYVPLDAIYPSKRLTEMFDDAGCRFVVTSGGAPDNLFREALHIDLIDHLAYIGPMSNRAPRVTCLPQNLAYIIYTSGSTGKPKGVQITHGALGNFMSSMLEQPGLRLRDKMLATTTMCFDIAGLELYLPLLRGAEVVISGSEIARNGQLLSKVIKDLEITVMQATPTTWRVLFASGWEGAENLKVLSGGEPLSLKLAERLLACCAQVWNLYGPNRDNRLVYRALYGKTRR